MKRFGSGAKTKTTSLPTRVRRSTYKLSILMLLFYQAFRFAAEPFFFSEAKKVNPQKTYALVMRYTVIAGS